jgi:hypothetical protein
MEERKKKPVPLPLIVLVALLVVGVILAVVLLQGPLADAGNQGEMALEKARKECASLLKEADYSGVAELYDSVSEFPQAQGEIKRQLKDHMLAAVKEKDAKRIAPIYHAFLQHKELLAVAHDALMEGVNAIWADPSDGDFPMLYQELVQEGVFLEELDAYCMEQAHDALQRCNLSDGQFWISLLSYSETHMERLQSFADELTNTYLEQGEYENAKRLFGRLEYVGLKRENAANLLLEAAYALMDRGEYTHARDLLSELQINNQPIFDLQAQFTLRLAFQYIYIENGEFAEAEKYAKSFAGDTREKMMEVLLQHTADREFIDAIEAAVLNRMEMEAAGAAWRAILDKELELLRDYRNRYFVDDTMKQLLVDYLDAVDGQRKTLFWEQTAEAADYFQQMEDKRLATLRTLARDYGFGEGDERLQNLLNRE